MMQLSTDIKNIHAHPDDLLIIGQSSFGERLNKLTKILQRLHDAGLKVNASESNFLATEIDYLGL